MKALRTSIGRAYHSPWTAVLKVFGDVLRAVDFNADAVESVNGYILTPSTSTLLHRIHELNGQGSAVMNLFIYLDDRMQSFYCGLDQLARST